MTKYLYEEYIRRLREVNDEYKTQEEHDLITIKFRSWCEGVYDGAGYRFNGDYYYIPKIDSGEFEDRPMCCGVFLDWNSRV